MTKYFVYFAFTVCMCTLSFTGCGSSGSSVVAPPADSQPESDVPVPGMSEEEYAREMQKASPN
ncbi:hypothetical protein NHH03_14440 [Stieleria sp. TO1_6]|uniref:hypothetical protein n=1 Tax=Stieleria tagensis TaxID=2956795 RepID=UPI00209AF4DB|nr:hypothetical protein [Stieleria tagensis]MCO8122944.1 hypothetical protein [Stieleria tagensis]